MVKHIVCFKLKDNSEEMCNKARDVLLGMKGKVLSALDIKVGVDFLHSPRSYDIILEVTLENRDMLDVYQNDEYHCSVVKPYMHSVRTESVAVDYDF